MRHWIPIALVAALALATPAHADEEEVPLRVLQLSFTFGGERQALALNGQPVAHFGAPLNYRDEERQDPGTIVAVALIGTVATLVLVNEGVEDFFDGFWGGGDDDDEINMGNNTDETPCQGIEIGDSCMGNGG